MKPLLPLFLLLPLTAQSHEIEDPADELLYGVEVLTGYRSEYIDRGFKLSNELIEVQLGAEIALSDQWMLDFGGWYGTETGSGSFDQASAFFGIRYDADAWQAGLDLAYNSYSHVIFEDGVQTGPYMNWFLGEDWRVGAALEYDSGADGWYGKLEAEWSKPTSANSYLTILGGVSATSGFYGQSGGNDGFARLSWSYQINRHVAVTPFLGTSIAMDAKRGDQIFGGLWFAVNF